jgi:hypothetical protein
MVRMDVEDREQTDREGWEHTCHGFLYFVENEVHELIVTFQCADDCIPS